MLLIEPYYDSYPAAVALAGATRRCVPLVADGDRFAVDLDALAGAITPATRALLLNSPHNPTGTRHLVRFAFCKRDEVLDEAIARLQAHW